jgi:hypothetical protein
VTISTTTNLTPAEQAQAPNRQTAVTKPEAAAPAKPDTVQISEAAKLNSLQAASQALLQEATETSAQTAQEARHGDHQAQRLVARYAAAHQ